MRRLGGIAERFCWQIADVTIAIELRPGPSAAFVVDHEAFAVERFGLERRVGVRRAFQRRARADDAHGPPMDVTGRFDMPLKMDRREVGTSGSEAAVKRDGGHGLEGWCRAKAAIHCGSRTTMRLPERRPSKTSFLPVRSHCTL